MANSEPMAIYPSFFDNESQDCYLEKQNLPATGFYDPFVFKRHSLPCNINDQKIFKVAPDSVPFYANQINQTAYQFVGTTGNLQFNGPEIYRTNNTGD